MSNTNKKWYQRVDWVDIIVGVILVILGLVIMFKLFEAFIAIALIFGILVIISGIGSIIRGVRLKKFVRGTARWVLEVVLGVLVIILGLILLFNPDLAIRSVGIFAGIYFIMTAVFNIIIAVMLWKIGAKVTSVISIILNVLMIITGIMLLGNWLLAGLTTTAVIGLGAIIRGVFAIIEGCTD